MDKTKLRMCGFMMLLVLWLFLTMACYEKWIVFDGGTLGGAMLLGFILTCSVLSLVQLLKIMYDKAYPTLFEKDEHIE